MSTYQPEKIESKWRKYWEDKKVFFRYDREKTFYALDMFPYPSGVGLHVGHPKGYIATDVVARKKQLEGYGVLHPMGWDGFGLPAENFAIKNKTHPEAQTNNNVHMFKEQLENIGLTYDWEREVFTYDPWYYKWTQWIFIKMYEKGLAYESYEPINWCPSCQTGLANEDLENGRCERCDSVIEQRPMRQWVLRMTEYTDRLLGDLDTEDLEWSDSILTQQKNWIGRSEGVELRFRLKNVRGSVWVFTTRVDTAFGCTFLGVAPDAKLTKELIGYATNHDELIRYMTEASAKTTIERSSADKEKTGVEMQGVRAVHPFTGDEIPIFVADYVLASYGTGAVMSVPAHDERDWEFAKKYNIPIKEVIRPDQSSQSKNTQNTQNTHSSEVSAKDAPYTGEGVLIASGAFTRMSSKQARKEMVEFLEEIEAGKRSVKYKMHDWVFSRQRYWGEPIPLIHCRTCGVVPVPEEELPLRLPKVEHYEPTGTGESPLANIEEWVHTTCPRCHKHAKRETNTMPQWAGSSWYYLRYISPYYEELPVDPNEEKRWMPVDLYVGGAEHATRHLLYVRFWHKFLFDIGVVSTKEPFKRLVNVGLIMGPDGRKMSKRWGNVIDPNDVIREFGADAFRLYEMFMGPFEQSIAWNTEGVSGVRRFLDKVWRLYDKVDKNKEGGYESLLHKTVKKVGEDIDAFRFNTAISQMMIFVNALEKEPAVSREAFATFLQLLSPFAPHITEELWQKLGNSESIFLSEWPEYDKEKIVEKTLTLSVQVNGKLRDTLDIASDITEASVREKVLTLEKVLKHLEGKEPKKIIVVPGRVVNIVV